MITADSTLPCLICILILFLGSALGQNVDNSTVSPSEARTLNCTGLDNFFDSNATFQQKNSFTKSSPFVRGTEVTARCEGTDLKDVRVKYGDGFDAQSVGNDTWNCTTYGNGYKNFTVMELTAYKPDNSSTKVTCTYDGKACSLVRESEKQSRFVIGMPSVCTALIATNSSGVETETTNRTAKNSSTTASPPVNTTATSDVSNTTEAANTTSNGTTTASPNTAANTTEHRCGKLVARSANRTFSPSEVATVSCSFRSCQASDNATLYTCPKIYPVVLEDLEVSPLWRTSLDNDSCTSTLEMYLTSSDSPRAQIPVECYLDHHRVVSYVTFQKKLHSEACKQDLDCMEGLWCVSDRCSCPKEKPAYVQYSNECLPALGTKSGN